MRKWVSILVLVMLNACGLFEADPSNGKSAELNRITIPDANFSPPFDPDVSEYDVFFASFPRSILLTAVAKDTAATIYINDESVASGQSIQVHTAPPEFTITIKVISSDGHRQKFYYLTIREKNANG
ncbi:MAG: hypothetical protein GF313_03475 [Caldithrix sp.]|nr:hypothetical protein [Caldithrix sp.]